MLGHQPPELVEVDGEAPLARELGGHLDREAVGRLEVERVLAADRALGRASSKSLSPRASVSPNFSSSAASTRAIASRCSTSSG